MPALVFLQAIVPAIKPSCASGWSNIAFLGVLAVVLHHVYAEGKAWAAVKSLVTKPEMVVLRQLGVLRKRAGLLFLAILEDLDIYTDMLFPVVVFSCDLFSEDAGTMTEMWVSSWRDMPVIGRTVGNAARTIRFWGWAAFFVLLNWIIEVVSLVRMLTFRVPDVDEGDKKISRVSGWDFFTIAQHAETAVMPSVALLSESMAKQKRWVFEAKDTRDGYKARENFVFGKDSDYSAVEQAEVTHQEEQARTDMAGRAFHICQLTGRILIGHTVQLWIQSSFLMYGFEQSGNLAKYKVIASMVLSSAMIITRSARAAGAIQQLGFIGIGITSVSMFMIAWSGLKVYHAYTCSSHVWNLSTGCVHLASPSEPLEDVVVTTTTAAAKFLAENIAQ